MKVSEVFGLKEFNEEFPKSYIVRKEISSKFDNAIEDNKHIIIYGSSKQGKSSLVKEKIKQEISYRFPLNSNTKCISEIYKNLLQVADILVSDEKITQGEISGKVEIELEGKLSSPISSVKTTGKRAHETKKIVTEKKKKLVDVNFSDVNSVINILKKTNNIREYFILDNYHQLPEKLKKIFAEHIRTWGEYGIKIIIVGIWTTQNKLNFLNPELSGKIDEIKVDPWEKEDLKKVIENGTILLNLHFDHTLKTKLIQSCCGSIGLLQILIMELLRKLYITRTSGAPTPINYEEGGAGDRFAEVLADQAEKNEQAYNQFHLYLRKHNEFIGEAFVSFLKQKGQDIFESGKYDLEIFSKDDFKDYCINSNYEHLESEMIESFFDEINSAMQKEKNDKFIFISDGKIWFIDKFYLFYLIHHGYVEG